MKSPGSTDRESTPSEPSPGPGGEGEEIAATGGQPTSPAPSPEDESSRSNSTDAPPPSSPAEERPLSPDERERWGDLPVQARDVFRTDGGDDFPPRYREWIDAYHRRLLKAR